MTDNAASAYGAELADSAAGLKRSFDLQEAAVKRDRAPLLAGSTIRPVREKSARRKADRSHREISA
jgi:hypothetical protein